MNDGRTRAEVRRRWSAFPRTRAAEAGRRSAAQFAFAGFPAFSPAPAIANEASAQNVLCSGSECMNSHQHLTAQYDVDLDVNPAIEKLKLAWSGSLPMARPKKPVDRLRKERFVPANEMSHCARIGDYSTGQTTYRCP